MEDNIPKFKLKKLGSDQEETKPAKPTTAEFETNQQDNHDAYTETQIHEPIPQTVSPEKKSSLRLRNQEHSNIQEPSEEAPKELPLNQFVHNVISQWHLLSATICIHCGYTKKREHLEDEERPSWIQAAVISKEALICLVIGLIMTLILTSGKLEFLRFVIHHFNILVHEFGHCAWSWMMGFQAFPAFDFQHGGGMTMTFGRKPSWAIAASSFFVLLGLHLNTETTK